MKLIEEKIGNLPVKELKSILGDPEKSANSAHLIYVHDTEPGIQRIKKGEGFQYVLGKSKKINKQVDLIRIKSLVIPPAWENVWICSLPNGHLQATGIDVKKRKQYKYHALWNLLRNHTKYYRLLQFGKAISSIRVQVEKDIALPGLCVEKVLALVVSLMEKTNIRVGNLGYEKLYGSFGLSTLKDKHVNINGNELRFCFKGKKGIEHTIHIKNKKLATIVQTCRDIPGKELFQYYAADGEKKSIDSGMVNTYIKKISGGNFTAKDFRTWAGTLSAFLAFKELGSFDTPSEAKQKVIQALVMVSKQLGNTPTVCKKYYVHPLIVALYESKSLEKYTAQARKISTTTTKAVLTLEEKTVMKILEKNQLTRQ